MTRSLSPDQLQQLLAGYSLYNLSPEESATLAALLAADGTLQQELDQLQTVLELAHDATPTPPPAHLRHAVLQAARAQAPVASPLAPARSSRPWGRWMGAAAAALIAGLSLSNILLWRTLQLERASQTQDLITVALGASDSAAPAQAEVVINPDTLAGSLTGENLPPLEPGNVYVLWTVVDPDAQLTLDDKNAILTTVFTVDEAGRVSQPIDLPAVYRRDFNLVRAVAITQENAAAPQAHRSPPILIQPL